MITERLSRATVLLHLDVEIGRHLLQGSTKVLLFSNALSFSRTFSSPQFIPWSNGKSLIKDSQAVFISRSELQFVGKSDSSSRWTGEEERDIAAVAAFLGVLESCGKALFAVPVR